jgi:hypothetical protein
MSKDEKVTSNLTDVPIASEIRRPKRPNPKPGAVDFVPKEFDWLLEDQGTKVKITPSILCPNRTELEDTNHTLDCPLCYGDEVIDLCDQATESWASITGIDLKKDMQVQGIWDIKDAKMTFQTSVRVYYWYKVEIIDFGSIYNQVVKRGSGDKDRLRYPRFGACDIPTYLMGKDGVSYRFNEDFIVDGQQLIWTGLKRPKSGDLYSISYPILPTFRVLELVHENRYYYVGFKQKEKVPVQLPQQAVVRWDYMTGRNKSGSRIDIP